MDVVGGDERHRAGVKNCLLKLQEVEVMCLNNAEDRVLRVDLTRSISAVTRSMSAVMNHQESAREI